MDCFTKKTVISGYDTIAPVPDVLGERVVHIMQHHRCYTVHGHWSGDAAERFAARHGIIAQVKVRHTTPNYPGMSS